MRRARLGLEMQIFLCIKIGIITEIFHVISLHLFGHAFPHIQLLYKTLFIIYSLKVLFILQKVLFYNTVIEKGGRTRCRNTKKVGYLTTSFKMFHLKDTSRREFHYHYHDFHKILILLGGDVTYCIEGRTLPACPGRHRPGQCRGSAQT